MALYDRDIIKVYEDETGRSSRIRGAEHLRDLEKKQEKSVLYKHKLTDHAHESVKFSMKIMQKFEVAMTRQANEAVRIYSRPAHKTLISKSEFNHPPLSRVVVDRRKNSDLGCGKTQTKER